VPDTPSVGGPTDAFEALGDALVKAAKAAPVATSEAHVAQAFALGWQMAELNRPQRVGPVKSTGDGLPELGSLDDAERIRILVEQIQAGITKLHDRFKESGLADPDASAVRDSLGQSPQDRSTAVRDLHLALLGSLTAADFRLGKAYGLGRAVADTCRDPADRASLQRELETHRVAKLLRWLDDLSSALPPHAGHSVARSLERWRDWADQLGDDAQMEGTLSALRRQGELWRALLSGEKRGTEMLEIDNYLDAARSLAARTRSVAGGVITRFPFLVVLIVGLFGGGVALLLSDTSSASIVAGAGGILASLGLTWKGIGGSLGQLVGKLEQPLWGAELDAAITQAITLLPENTADHRERRAVALAMPVTKPAD
jgi:hypothetical protein